MPAQDVPLMGKEQQMIGKTNTKTVLEDVSALREGAAERVSDAVGSAQDQAAAVSRVVQKSAEEIASEISKKLREAGVDTDRLLVTAREQAEGLRGRLLDEVRERPIRAIGVAALAGVMLGLMSSR